MTKPVNNDDSLVVEVGHTDLLQEKIHELEARGFEPVVVVFRDATGEVEILSRGVDLADFTSWLLTTWIPNSRDLNSDRGPGH